MKAKDLINLLFKKEESKEVQESLFYTQFGTISQYFREYHRNEFKQQLTEQFQNKYIEFQTMDYITEEQSKVFISLIEVLVIENNLNINDIIN